MKLLWRLLLPLKPFGLFLEGMAWYGSDWPGVGWHLASVSDPTQVGPLRSDPDHYDEMGRYLWWCC